MFHLVVTSPSKIPQDFLDNLDQLFLFESMKGVYRELSEKGYAREYDIPVPTPKFRGELKKMSELYKVDTALIPVSMRNVRKRLVVFDMDSTLIQQEVIVEMAREFGIQEKVKEITERAMNGQLDFDSALRERIALLKGFPRSHMERIRARLTLSPGVAHFVRTFRLHGGYTAIASGGFHYFADFFKESLPMEFAIANNLDWDGDCLSGVVTGEIVNAKRKEEFILDLTKKLGLYRDQTMAVGDGANDLLMLRQAGMGIAWHAKEVVRAETDYAINYGPMTTLLYYLGFEGEFFEAL